MVDNLFADFAYEGMMAAMGKDFEEFMLAFRRLSYTGHDLLSAMCSTINHAATDKKEAFAKIAPILFFGSSYKKR